MTFNDGRTQQREIERDQTVRQLLDVSKTIHERELAREWRLGLLTVKKLPASSISIHQRVKDLLPLHATPGAAAKELSQGLKELEYKELRRLEVAAYEDAEAHLDGVCPMWRYVEDGQLITRKEASWWLLKAHPQLTRDDLIFLSLHLCITGWALPRAKAKKKRVDWEGVVLGIFVFGLPGLGLALFLIAGIMGWHG
jgi:hypothetical protein